MSHMNYKEILLEEEIILEKLVGRNANEELINRQKMVVRAIKKQVAQEVTTRRTRYQCPTCKSLFIGRPEPYCGMCGQKVNFKA